MNLHVYNINLNVNINVSDSNGLERADSPSDLVQERDGGAKRTHTDSPNKPTDDVGLDPFDIVNKTEEEDAHNEGSQQNRLGTEESPSNFKMR